MASVRAETAAITINAPVRYQVVQRSTAGDPTAADRPGDLGHGCVTVTGETPVLHEVTEAWLRVVPLVDAFGSGCDWTQATLECDGTRFTARADVPAGGWYRIEIRLEGNGNVVAEGDVSPVGVGEVFIVAGQSYMAGCHAVSMSVEDALGRVAATSPESPSWRVAHDPQPAIVTRIDDKTAALLRDWGRVLDLRFPRGESSPFRGSVWPALGNQLMPLLRVPLGFIHVAVGSTTVAQWQPQGVLYANLRDAVRLGSDHRAVLWGLGESDAIANTPTREYIEGMRLIRSALVSETGLDRPWIVGKTTIHPAYGSNPIGERAIRDAVDRLWGEDGFVRGPDTDVLDGLGVHRADDEHGGHYTELGQRRAALLWFAAIWHALAVRS